MQTIFQNDPERQEAYELLVSNGFTKAKAADICRHIRPIAVLAFTWAYSKQGKTIGDLEKALDFRNWPVVFEDIENASVQ